MRAPVSTLRDPSYGAAFRACFIQFARFVNSVAFLSGKLASSATLSP